MRAASSALPFRLLSRTVSPGDIGKVQIDETGIFDQIGNAGHGLLKHIVSNFKGIGQGDLLIGGKFEAVIRDNQKRVYLGEKILNALVGLIQTLLSLKLERLRHDAYREAAGFPGDLGNRRPCAGSCSATHTGGDKDHIGIFHGLGNVVSALLSGAFANFRIRSCTLSAGDLLADLDLLIGIGNGQCLLVRIDGNKLDTLGAGLHHTVDYVVSCSPDSYDLDRHNISGPVSDLKSISKPPNDILSKRVTVQSTPYRARERAPKT